MVGLALTLDGFNTNIVRIPTQLLPKVGTWQTLGL